MGKVELYPHNQEAYKKIEQSIANGDKKIAISHATGTGKSYLIAKLCEDYNEDKKLVLVPSRHIKKEIKCLLKENYIKNVDVKLYQGLIKMSDECISAMNYKIVALDEYHHDTARVWGYKVRTLIDSHPETIFFGTSATPVRTDGVNVIDELFDGNCVSNISLAQAIARGIVPCPKYVAAFYTLDERLNELRRKIEKSTNSKEEKDEFYEKINTMRSQIEKSYGMPIILNNNIKDREGRYIVFCKNKKHLEKVKETVIDWFKTAGFKNINSYVVHSSYESKDEEYEAFCNDTSHSLKLLFCINMLNEGSHKANISGALLLRKTNSYIMLLQQIGRTIESGKTNNPIIIDAVNNFIYVKDGIKLLTEIKEAIEEEKKTNKDFDESKFIDIDTFFVTEYVQNIENMLYEVESCLNGNWELNFKALAQYKNREGDCLVPKNHIEDVDGSDVKLGIWCKNIRQIKKGNQRGLLTEEREEQLNQLGFIWDVRQIDAMWENKFEKMCEYKNKYGHFFQITDRELSIWAAHQRAEYRNGNMSQWRIDKLNGIGFCWDSLEESFYYNCFLYEEYIKTHNKYVLINRKEYPILSNWCTKIRMEYKNGKLSEERINKLNDIGFIFDSKKAYFDAGIKYYCHYKKSMEYIPKGFITDDGFPLDSWISSQKNKKRRNSLTEYEKKELQKIGFSFSDNNDKFDYLFNLFCDYLKENNHNMDVSQKLIYKGEKLGQAISSWRSSYRNGSLSTYRKEKLESIGFCWNIKDFYWTETLKFIVNYKKDTGKDISKSDKKMKKYYNWIVNNRMWLKQGKLSDEKANILINSGIL